jgi:hypothetical protein
MLYPQDLIELIENHYDETIQLLLDYMYTNKTEKKILEKK